MTEQQSNIKKNDEIFINTTHGTIRLVARAMQEDYDLQASRIINLINSGVKAEDIYVITYQTRNFDRLKESLLKTAKESQVSVQLEQISFIECSELVKSQSSVVENTQKHVILYGYEDMPFETAKELITTSQSCTVSETEENLSFKYDMQIRQHTLPSEEPFNEFLEKLDEKYRSGQLNELSPIRPIHISPEKDPILNGEFDRIAKSLYGSSSENQSNSKTEEENKQESEQCSPADCGGCSMNKICHFDDEIDNLE